MGFERVIIVGQAFERAGEHVRSAQARVDIALQAALEFGGPAREGDGDDARSLRAQARENCIEDGLLMHHPAEDDIFICAAGEKIIEDMADIIQYHGFCLVRDGEGVHLPAPVAVEKRAGGEHPLEQAAGCGFSHAHRAADEIQRFLHIRPPFLHSIEVFIKKCNFLQENCVFPENRLTSAGGGIIIRPYSVFKRSCAGRRLAHMINSCAMGMSMRAANTVRYLCCAA